MPFTILTDYRRNISLLYQQGRKSFDKIQYPFMIKTLRKLGIEGDFHNLIKSVYNNPTPHITLNGK